MVVKIQSHRYTACIDLAKGVNCVSLRNAKFHAVILREPKRGCPVDNPYLYGMPILYPVNRIAGGSFTFEGRLYRFPINEPKTNCHLHGMLHEMEFWAEEIGDDFVKCVFEGQYLDFPHRFRVEMVYSLSERGLLHRTKITNLSGENMPNFLGFHTTFQIPFTEQSAAENIRLFAELGDEVERDNNYLPTGKILPCDAAIEKINRGEFMPFEKMISKNCRIKNGGRMELRDEKKNIRLVYENDPQFLWRLIYNGNADEYICLEPMTCMANCQNAPFARSFGNFDSIAPYSSKEYVSKIYIEEMQ